MNQTILHVDFSALYQAPLLDAQILREVLFETICIFGTSDFALSLVEIPEKTLLAA